ncbi:MAG TPA: hypothetical protein EYN06_10135 [Myxococcales bacterium]|nr:hypothetical protein [Myxococcales bacterium]HIN86829.1 hypothetical protein [Myxococcales bacterium]
MFFKAKDYVTAGNAICGLASVVCVMHDQIYYAGVLILVSWIFDALDGVVARMTNTFNKFGGEFDNMCDHLTSGICPGFIVYGVYTKWMPGEGLVPIVLACLIAFVLPMTATIRHAYYTVKPISVPGFWIGLPRPTSGYFTVAYFNSSPFSEMGDWGYYLGIGLVLCLGAANVGSYPFLSHHKHVWKKWVGPLMGTALAICGLLLLLGPLMDLAKMALVPTVWFFDAFVFICTAYCLFQWYGAPSKDRERARAAVAEWKKQPDPA